ncbi:MAG: nitroreductase [Paludibacter sp.]|nr:nitroreductase [Paludibacter sp.]
MKKTVFLVLSLGIIIASNTSCQSKGNAQNQSKSEIVNENILARRSIRAYTALPVSRDTIDLIMKSAINSPSARNDQPWEVRVISNADFLAKIKAVAPDFYNAPTLILVANDTTNSYSPFDTGIFTQTVMLSAESYGLGTVALGRVAHALNSGTPEANAVVAELNLPANYRIIIGIALGHKAQFPEAKQRNPNKVQILE